MAVAAFVLLALSATAQAPALPAPVTDLSGEWHFDVNSQNGPGRRDVLFRQEGHRVIGFIASDSASGRFVGSIAGESLEFTAVLEFGGEPMAAVYRATVQADTMSGTIDFGLYGRGTFTGQRGRRPEAAKPGSAPAIEGSARDAGIIAAVAGDLFGVLRDGALHPEMVPVPGGRFRMGYTGPAATAGFGDDYATVHEVELSAFSMSRFLVTNAQYAAFAAATKRAPPLPPKGWGDYAARFPNHPVVNVNFADAAAYADWLTATAGTPHRLPTEAEWEYAARGGVEGRAYVFGDEWQIAGANTAPWRIGRLVDRDGWKQWWDAEGDRLSKSQPMTTRVGSFPPNGFGLYDMAGNVWQWTGDWYRADYYASSPAKNPAGPANGAEKVLRGCSWYNQPDVCLVATRDRYAPERRLYYNGFRVVAGL